MDFEIKGRRRSVELRLQNRDRSVSLKIEDAFVINGVTFTVTYDNTISSPSSSTKADKKLEAISISEQPRGSKVKARNSRPSKSLPPEDFSPSKRGSLLPSSARTKAKGKASEKLLWIPNGDSDSTQEGSILESSPTTKRAIKELVKLKPFDPNMNDTIGPISHAARKHAEANKTKRGSFDDDGGHTDIFMPDSSDDTDGSPTRRKKAETSGALSNFALSPAAAIERSQDVRVNVAFASSSKIYLHEANMKGLNELRVFMAKNIEHCDLYCVKKGERISRSPSLLKATLLGKQVVTDEWLTVSLRYGSLANPLNYCATDPEREQTWGTSLADAIKRGSEGSKPFHGYTVTFTVDLKNDFSKEFDSISELVLLAGAKDVNIQSEVDGETSKATLVCAKKNDSLIQGLRKNGHSVYAVDIITYSILRGFVDLDSDEFMLVKGTVTE